MKIKVRGLEFYEGDSGDRPFTILAHGTVVIDRVTISGVTLTWTEAEGVTALAPAARLATGAKAVMWDCRDGFAHALAKEMLELFTRMGGELPKPKQKPRYIPYSELEIDPDSDIPLREQAKAALYHIHKETGEKVFTSMIQWPEPSLVTKTLGDEDGRDAKAMAYDESVARRADERAAAIAAAKSGEMERRVFPATWSAVEDDAAGLHRVLGVDAVAETLERAGL